MGSPTARRREKQRQATLTEIRAAARHLLTSQGPAAVTVNAVAREVGMSGPALYHYFSGLGDLVSAVTADFYEELAGEMAAARDAHPATAPARRLLATCRAMRDWATGHRAEFGWIFAAPIPPADRDTTSPRHQAALRFERVFLDQVVEIWESRPFPVADPAGLDPSLRAQLRAYCASIGDRLPPEAAHTFLTCWIRLYGLLCMEVLHQLDFAYTDPEPVFEEHLRELCATLGLDPDGP